MCYALDNGKVKYLLLNRRTRYTTTCSVDRAKQSRYGEGGGDFLLFTCGHADIALPLLTTAQEAGTE